MPWSLRALISFQRLTLSGKPNSMILETHGSWPFNTLSNRPRLLNVSRAPSWLLDRGYRLLIHRCIWCLTAWPRLPSNLLIPLEELHTENTLNWHVSFWIPARHWVTYRDKGPRQIYQGYDRNEHGGSCQNDHTTVLILGDSLVAVLERICE